MSKVKYGFISNMLRQMFSIVMLNLPDWRAIFAPNGRLLREGELIQRVNLSRTLTTIANEGPGALYKVR